ncbi:MAG: formyltetrahydrofolate deformylase [Solirubrobacteraceae bacterium]
MSPESRPEPGTPTSTDSSPAPADAAVADIARLLISCPDRRGIIAAVSGFLHRRGVNIVQSDQYSTDPEGGSFYLRMVLHVPDVRDRLPRLREEFATEVAEPLAMRFALTDASVPKRVAVMVSRYDHCLLDLLWRWRRSELGVEIGIVVSNWPDLEAEVARFGVPYHHVPVTRDTKAAAESRQLELIGGRFDLIVLARYMQVLSANFLECAGCPIINIHHSFLPAFAGAGPYERAKARGVKLIGATAHYATHDLDEGPIIEQDVIRVTHRDSEQELIRLGADVERSVLARAVRWHCEDRVIVHGSATVVF